MIVLFQITQIGCDSNLRAPQGCTQYFYGSDSQRVRSYNFNGGQGLHLGKYYMVFSQKTLRIDDMSSMFGEDMISIIIDYFCYSKSESKCLCKVSS